MLGWEAAERHRRSLERRLRDARIGPFKPLADFDWKWPTHCDRAIVEELMTLAFLEDASNIVLVGPNGVGKTMCACNLGYQAVLTGRTALFITAAQLLGELASLDSDSALRRRLRHYAAPDLLMIDEVGYSFGGILARSVLTTQLAPPRPLRLVLVASPMRSLRMCRAVGNWSLFRWLTGDCGKLLASESSMQAVALPDVRTTCIYGTRGYAGPFAPAGCTANDGFVAVAEIDPLRFDDIVPVRASHPAIPSSRAVLEAIDSRLSGVA